ncbi:MAG: urease accessory protein UreF [Verrucomicrobia bacterium]|nr:urease accessory protein UreF [Verrucomicrobiota bacterium]
MDFPGDTWLVWQLIDSSFPAGSLGHSGGLEAAWQMSGIRVSGGLEEFLHQLLENQGASMLPLVREAIEGTTPFAELDQLCHVFLVNPPANQASRQQGRAFLAAIERGIGLGDCSESLRVKLDRDRGGHLAPVFGWVMRQLQIQPGTAGRMYLYHQLRGWISAAVRMNLVGPFEAQRIQLRLSSEAEGVWARCRSLSLEDMAQTFPLADLWQMHHPKLYSRLFQS